MQSGHVLLNVPNVEAAVAFYETAFGFKPCQEDRAAGWAEMRFGGMTLVFQSEVGADASTHSYAPLRPNLPPPGMELVLTRDDVLPAYIRALLAGAEPLREPALNAQGRLVASVRDLNGVVVDLCAPESA